MRGAKRGLVTVHPSLTLMAHGYRGLSMRALGSAVSVQLARLEGRWAYI